MADVDWNPKMGPTSNEMESVRVEHLYAPTPMDAADTPKSVPSEDESVEREIGRAQWARGR